MSAQDRDALRARMRSLRRAMGEQEQARCAEGLARRILASQPYRQARTVMLYAAAKGEISLAAVLEDALAAGKCVLLPLCEGPGIMTARLLRSAEDLRPGAYGVPEPPADSPVIPPQEIDLVLVPGTAFDAGGGRLGQGGGYYDRFLAQTQACRMGVCHSFALVDAVPMQAHDMRMDAVATEKALILCGMPPERQNR